jgi:transcriptional activator SPT7
MAKHVKGIEKHIKGIEDEDLDGTPGVIGGEAEEDEGILLPDYYYPLSCVPELPWRTIWANDEGEVEMPDETLRLAPRRMFVQPKSELANKIDANIRQMQDTRKVCAKISVVKQMQVQTQVGAAPNIGPTAADECTRCMPTNSRNTTQRNSWRKTWTTLSFLRMGR